MASIAPQTTRPGSDVDRLESNRRDGVCALEAELAKIISQDHGGVMDMKTLDSPECLHVREELRRLQCGGEFASSDLARLKAFLMERKSVFEVNIDLSVV